MNSQLKWDEKVRMEKARITLDKTTKQAFTSTSKKWHAYYTSLLITEAETGKFDSEEWH